MSKIIVCKGIQGSGKSTWAKEFCTNNQDWIRVCRDDLRTMRGKYWIPRQEDLITTMEYECIVAALSEGYNVVIDSMNLNSDKVRARMDVIKDRFPDLTWETKDFTSVSLEQCIKNDLKRPNSIGEKIIRETYNKYFPTEKIVQNPDLPSCIIVDIDGTLAKMGKRSAYDWHKVGEDSPNKFVIEIVTRFYNTHKIFVFSGRDEVCRLETVQWLEKNLLGKWHDLKMRPEGNIEKDVIVKQRMFDENIRAKYFVDFVIDDRLQVCRLWHSLGLNLLRVGNPDADF